MFDFIGSCCGCEAKKAIHQTDRQTPAGMLSVVQLLLFSINRLMVYYSFRLRTLRHRRVQLMIPDCHLLQMILTVRHAHLSSFAYAS
jgi:hypothetical protein